MSNKELPSQDLKLDKEKTDKVESLLRERMLTVHEKAKAKTAKKQPLLPSKEPTSEHEKESEPKKSEEEAKPEREVEQGQEEERQASVEPEPEKVYLEKEIEEEENQASKEWESEPGVFEKSKQASEEEQSEKQESMEASAEQAEEQEPKPDLKGKKPETGVEKTLALQKVLPPPLIRLQQDDKLLDTLKR